MLHFIWHVTLAFYPSGSGEDIWRTRFRPLLKLVLTYLKSYPNEHISKHLECRQFISQSSHNVLRIILLEMEVTLLKGQIQRFPARLHSNSAWIFNNLVVLAGHILFNSLTCVLSLYYLFINRILTCLIFKSLQWRHNELNGVSNHQRLHCLLNCRPRRRSKKTSKLRVIGLCTGNSLGTGEFLAQKASSAENVSIWWCHHVQFRASSDCIRISQLRCIFPLTRHQSGNEIKTEDNGTIESTKTTSMENVSTGVLEKQRTIFKK